MTRPEDAGHPAATRTANQAAKSKSLQPAAFAGCLPLTGELAKLKTSLRKRAARSFDAFPKALDEICALFSIEECRNYFKAAGYQADKMQPGAVVLNALTLVNMADCSMGLIGKFMSLQNR